jgi:hypothetical protein
MAWSVIRRYQNAVEAEADRAVLEASGIEAHVLVDDAGGMLPSLTMLLAATLVVREEDVPEAEEVLRGPETFQAPRP